ncbi:hypothetical protein GCM10028777_16820 [Angustibacter speluncae]
MRPLPSLAAATTLAVAGVLAISPAAHAATAADLSTALAAQPELVTGAELVSDPSGGQSSFVGTTPIAGFPTDGSTFTVLSSGRAGDLYAAPSSFVSTSWGGTSRSGGGSDFDVTVLRIDFTAPVGSNCLTGFDFKFLSEEFPDYVGQNVNDAFIVELDRTTWTTANGTDILAPDNIAFDPNGNVISINAGGDAVLNAANAAGTPYGGATETLTARTPITAGPHSLYFTIFDQGDDSYDSTVLVDDLKIGTVADVATQCRRGAQSATTVVAAPVTFSDVDGTASDTYTVPAVDGVVYSVGGSPVAAGTYPGSGTVTVTAAAAPGYTLDGTSSWSYAFTDLLTVTPAAPTRVDDYGTAQDTYTIPSSQGVDYQVGGVTVPAGTHPHTTGSDLVVTAVAQPGYALAGATSWTLSFSDITLVTPAAPTAQDPYGTAQDTYTIPSTQGVDYRVDGVTVATGTHPHTTGTDLVVTAVAQPGYALSGATSWTLAFSDTTLVTATAPTRVDDYGTTDDTFTVPSTQGVDYQVGGVTVPAGTHPHTTGTDLAVTAVPQAGYALSGPTSWTLSFTDIALVTATAPTATDDYGTAQDTYTIPAGQGVDYQVGGVTVPAGTHPHTSGTDVVVTAVPQAGYALTGTTSWTLSFTDIALVTATAPTRVDDFGTASDTYAIPTSEGVDYQVGGVTAAAGTHPHTTGTDLVVTAVPRAGYALSGATSWTLSFSDITLVSPAAPTAQDPYGTAQDTYTIPSSQGVDYQVGGVTVPAGTHPHTTGSDLVVTAVAQPGYALAGATSWTLSFSDITLVTPAAPTAQDPYGTAQDTYTIPSTQGVDYRVGGVTVAAGTHPHTTGTDLVVTAVAQAGYALAGQTSWTLAFTDVRAVTAKAPGHVDLGGTSRDRLVVPSVPGVRYLVDGVPTPAGSHPVTGTVVVTAEALPGYVLVGPSTWTETFDAASTPVAVPTAGQVPVVPAAGTSPGTYTIPDVPGVRFFVDGVEVEPGTYTGSGDVVVRMVAEDGYELVGPDTLVLSLGVVSTPAVPPAPARADAAALVRTGSGSLPRTGAPVLVLLAAATTLLGAGAGALLASRALRERTR